jgi:hypothetical protein
MVFPTATLLVLKPREKEPLRHWRTQGGIALSPMFVSQRPAFSPVSNEVAFETFFGGNLFILFAGAGGEDSLYTPFQKVRHRTPMDNLD